MLAFEHGNKTENAGMCVALLSLSYLPRLRLSSGRTCRFAGCIIGLDQDDWALSLNSWVAVDVTHVSGSDESTSSQMVRGMNKLAVQVATG